MQCLQILDALLGRHQLGRKSFCSVGVLNCLVVVAGSSGLIGEVDCLARVGVELFDLVELTAELHLELTLITDHRRSLLGQRLMLALCVLDRLLNLNLWICLLIDLRIEERHQVLPALDERISHWFDPASI